MTQAATKPPPPINKGEEFRIKNIATTGRKLPGRIVLHAPEGFGKTSFAAQAKDPLFLMTKMETGLLTLMDYGQLPESIAHFPEPAECWLDAKRAVNELIVNDHAHKTLVIDTMNGLERLLHESVCEEHYHGDWGEKGFLGFQRGYGISLKPLNDFLALLDELRLKKQMAIILLCHTKVNTFKNPDGPDYDRFEPALHRETWSTIHKWADMVLFGLFETVVDTTRAKDTKGKGKGGQARIIHTQRSAAWDAKNRHGLPPEIDCGDSPKTAWANFITALKQGRKAD